MPPLEDATEEKRHGSDQYHFGPALPLVASLFPLCVPVAAAGRIPPIFAPLAPVPLLLHSVPRWPDFRPPVDPSAWTVPAPEPPPDTPQPPVALPASDELPALQAFKFPVRRPLLERYYQCKDFATRHWKLCATLLPVILAAMLYPSVSRMPARKVSSPISSSSLASVREGLRRRAAIVFSDDFRSGLDDWQGSQQLAISWKFDTAGFVRPGALAMYRPSAELTDYKVEFLGQIKQKGLGLAYRIVDWNHYYVVKFVVAKPGPLPEIALERYAVDGVRLVGRVTRSLAVSAHDGSMYRISLDAHGRDFTLISQGKIVDVWSDDRYTRGGIGFFCGKGERARLRWVEVSHQNDTFGRLCALLAPANGQNRNGN